MSNIYKTYLKKTRISNEESNEEKEIKKYIEQNPHGDFSNILKYDGRWNVFYHLTEMRKSLFNWYEFRDQADLLEIGGDMGALTGLFCERCTHVTTVESSEFKAEAIHSRYRSVEHLDIYVGDILDIKFDKKFDYITLVGCSNLSTYLLKILSGLLKVDGKILLATDNRFGMKYWCGAREDSSKLPFEGINGYLGGTESRLYGKKELESMMELAGLSYYKFYYPLPDYKLPQVIYSEKYLPQNNLKSRVIPYYLDRSTLVANEKELYDDIIDNNVFEFFSNSFLVECGLDNSFNSVIYAAVTTDRTKSGQFSTTIHENNIVKKTPLHILGEKSLQGVYENLRALQLRDIKVVPNRIEKNSLIMPKIECESLENYLKKVISGDKDEFIHILDEFYKEILKSSTQIKKEDNFFFDKNNPNIAFGPILKTAFIDLIPNNCFYCEGQFVFFDQEFTRENFPAGFIMFRALKYTYLFIPFANDYVSLDELKLRYNLLSVWDIYELEDMKFVSDNRNYSIYSSFLKWSYLDNRVLSQNVQKLGKSLIVDTLSKRGFQRIAIYGYGHRGTTLYSHLKDSGIDVVYAIDRNAENIKKTRYTDIPVFSPENINIPVDAIIVSISNAYESIHKILKVKFECTIISLDNIVEEEIYF